MKQYICDRCGTVISKESFGARLKVQLKVCEYADWVNDSRYGPASAFEPDEEYDLCNKCVKDLARFVLRPDYVVVPESSQMEMPLEKYDEEGM